MIKIKVFKSPGWCVDNGSGYHYVHDYCQCTYLFGVLIHSVTILNIHPSMEDRMFNKKNIIYNTR